MDAPEVEVANPFTRFARWRRESGGWTYSLMFVAWVGLTAVAADSTGWGWRVYAVSASVYALLFEVGLAYLIRAAWGSHRQLEYEGFVAVLVGLYEAGLDEDAICRQMKIAPEALLRLKSQLNGRVED